MATVKEKALDEFKAFLEKLSRSEVSTKYLNPKIKTNKQEVLFRAEGEDERSPGDPWIVTVIWKKDSNNLFYFRDYEGVPMQPEGIRAKGEESLRSLLSKLLTRIKKNG